MPPKSDHLSKRILAAFRSMERQICGGWASQRQCYEKGFRDGYNEGRSDEAKEWIGNAQAIMDGHEVPSREALPSQPKEVLRES